PDAGGVFTFHADFSTLPPTESAVAMQIVGVDAVGNAADAGFSVSVDNVPPSVTLPTIDTAPDGTDGAGQPWFKGPTVAPAAGPVTVSAAITDPNLVITGPNAPAAAVGVNRYPGTFNSGSGRWTFAIPRGAGAAGVTFDAQDVAGNHSTAAGGLTLHFDDVSFVVLVTGDTNWYARVASVTPTVGVTLSAAPASGISSIVLKVSGKADVPCTGSSTTYSCALPSAYAPAGQEAPLALSVV